MLRREIVRKADTCELRLAAAVEISPCLYIERDFLIVYSGEEGVLRSVCPASGKVTGLMSLVPRVRIGIGFADIVEGYRVLTAFAFSSPRLSLRGIVTFSVPFVMLTDA